MTRRHADTPTARPPVTLYAGPNEYRIVYRGAARFEVWKADRMIIAYSRNSAAQQYIDRMTRPIKVKTILGLQDTPTEDTPDRGHADTPTRPIQDRDLRAYCRCETLSRVDPMIVDIARTVFGDPSLNTLSPEHYRMIADTLIDSVRFLTDPTFDPSLDRAYDGYDYRATEDTPDTPTEDTPDTPTA